MAAMKFPAPNDYVPKSVGKDNWDPYVLDMVSTELKDVYHISQTQLYTGGYVIHTLTSSGTFTVTEAADPRWRARPADEGYKDSFEDESL